MESSELRRLAESFRNARLTQEPISAPSTSYPQLDVKSAMGVQKHTVELALQNGDRIVGYKLGNIAKAMQEAFGVDEPDYGNLMASSFLYEVSKVRLKNFIEPLVELEPAFVLKGPLKGPNATVADVISAIDYVVPAIEVIDSRVKDWAISLEDTLADSGSSGAIILGGSPRRVTDLDLGHIRGHLSFNGVEIMSGSTRNILGNPFAAVAWLINRLAEFDIGFIPGQVILPGSCLRAMPMDKAGRWSCTYEGWGTIEFDVV